MLFFRNVCVKNMHLTKKYMNRPSLRVQKPALFQHIENSYLFRKFGKRVFFFIFRKSKKAGMTLEAALVVPIFLFAMLSLISVFDVIKIKNGMDLAVAEAGNELAIESYGEYADNLFTPLYVYYKIKNHLSENLSEKYCEMVSKYIVVSDLSFLEEDNTFRFRVDYKVTPDFFMTGFSPFYLHTSYYGHKWLGYSKNTETEIMVYISENADVYHKDKNCSYLQIEIMEISYEELSNRRNQSGHKYKECGFCDRLEGNGKIYITQEGESYHNAKNCIGLTRTVYTVPLSKVSYKKVCSRCGDTI